MSKMKMKIRTGTVRQTAVSNSCSQKFVEIETEKRRYVLQEGIEYEGRKFNVCVAEKGKRGIYEQDGVFSLEEGLGYMLEMLLKEEGLTFDDIT